MVPKTPFQVGASSDKGYTCALPHTKDVRVLYWGLEISISRPCFFISSFVLFLLSSITWSFQDKDLGVVNEPVGDRGSHGS